MLVWVLKKAYRRCLIGFLISLWLYNLQVYKKLHDQVNGIIFNFICLVFWWKKTGSKFLLMVWVSLLLWSTFSLQCNYTLLVSMKIIYRGVFRTMSNICDGVFFLEGEGGNSSRLSLTWSSVDLSHEFLTAKVH